MTTATRNAKDVTVKSSRVMEQAAAAAESALAGRMTADDIKAEIEARVQAQLDRALASAGAERAELENWWDIFAIGPIQVTGAPPVQPGCVVKAGEPAFAVSVLVLNPFLALPGPTDAATLLSSFGLPYEVQFQTSNISAMIPALADVQASNLIPGVFFYVNVSLLPTATPGMYETNILARIEGAGVPASAPQFGGFATAILDLDNPGLFGPGPGVNFNQPIRYVVYP
ncbi:MAG TPA: hypothetical protein VF897_24280 [Roseiflexaceae bacterium]